MPFFANWICIYLLFLERLGGKGFGVPSVIAEIMRKELFSDQISSGWAYSADSPEEIISGIKTQFHNREELNRPEHTGTRKAGDKKDVIRLMKEQE